MQQSSMKFNTSIFELSLIFGSGLAYDLFLLLSFHCWGADLKNSTKFGTTVSRTRFVFVTLGWPEFFMENMFWRPSSPSRLHYCSQMFNVQSRDCNIFCRSSLANTICDKNTQWWHISSLFLVENLVVMH